MGARSDSCRCSLQAGRATRHLFELRRDPIGIDAPRRPPPKFHLRAAARHCGRGPDRRRSSTPPDVGDVVVGERPGGICLRWLGPLPTLPAASLMAAIAISKCPMVVSLGINASAGSATLPLDLTILHIDVEDSRSAIF